ncbi:MAG: carbohydrate kinase family protein [Propylenella sp.]
MILCMGETLIDFIPAETRDGVPAYRPAVGGSPGNVALTLARLDVPAGFVGGVSTDFFGEEIFATLAKNGVAMDYVPRLDRPTMLAFVDLKADEPRYAFFDNGAAARHWRLEDMPPIADGVNALHFGSLSLIRKPAASAFAALMSRERTGRTISFDPNIRAGLVEDEADYRARLEEFLRSAHVIKLSGADLDWIAPGEEPERFAARRLGEEARLVLFTRGSEGASLFSRSGASVSRLARNIEVVDTVGAGDSMMGGLLAALFDRNALERSAIERLSETDLAGILDFALAVAAVTCSRVGADPPRRAELGL